MNWYFKTLGNYATFEGRARRREYWYFALINALIGMAFGIAMSLSMSSGKPPTTVFALYGIFVLLILLPSIAVTVRRLHDTDRSGWWFWISLVPAVGGIVLFVFTVLDSTPGSNQYGPSPKTIVA